jgi:Putative beta-barrel porin-2, OmpL-like. bbp2
MNNKTTFTRISILVLFLLTASVSFLRAQKPADTIPDEIISKILNSAKHLTLGFYIDTYINIELDKKTDTSNVVPFSSNCPIRDQIRLNVAAIEAYYSAERVRGKLALQWGDAPNLLATPDAQFIKTIRQANFGFRIVKNLWVDFGYMFNPIGYESSWAVLNDISTVTIGGYFSPGSVLGWKFSYKFSEKFDGGLMIGNPYSLAYKQNNHLAGIVFLNYRPLNTLTVTYNNFFGNQALRNAKRKNDMLYNEFLITWKPLKNLAFVGQIDFAFQTNSQGPDSNKVAGMSSGFLQARYSFLKYFAFTARYEMFDDPHGFLTGTYSYDGKTTGLATSGFALAFDYKPVKIGYMRVEYKFIQANSGNNVFYGYSNDFMQALVFTSGVRF